MRQERPKTPLATLIGRHLMPGETLLAGFGVGIAVVLLLTTVLSMVWALHVEHRTATQAQREQLTVVGELLSSNIESMLRNGDVSAVRRMLLNVAHRHELSVCRVTSGDGAVLADMDPRAIQTDQLAAGGFDADFTATTTMPEEGVVRSVHPIVADGRTAAKLELVKSLAMFASTSLPVPLGAAAAAVVTLIALLLLYRRIRRRLTTAMLIRDALTSLGQSDLDESAAVLDVQLGEEARIWNSLLAQVSELRSAAIGQRAESLLHQDDDAPSDLNAACDAMPDGLILLDAQMNVVYANGAAGVFLGQPRDALRGKPLDSLVNDPRVATAASNMQKNRGSARGIVEIDRRDQGAQGVLRFIARPVRQCDDAAVMIIIQDVTQQRVAHESHSAFLAQAAHELRTPLTNIRLHVEEAIESGDEDPAYRSQCLNVINSETTRLTRIVGDMLSVAEIEAGALALREDDIHMETILRQLEKDQVPSAAEKRISLKFHLPPKLPSVYGDQDKVLLALHNLLGNAIKYTPEGGTVTVEVETHGEMLEIRVIDSGFGISDEERDRVFDKFYRANDKRVRAVTGSGLGLPLAREVLRMHGGDITLESTLDEGSTFTLTLPAREAPVVA